MQSFLSEFSDYLKATWGNQLNKILVVFNNKRPISFLQHHLSDHLVKPIWSPQFLTIDEWIGTLDSSYRMDEIEEFFVLHQLYNHLLIEEEQSAITQDDFLAFSEIILQDFNQIMNYLVDAKSLFSYLEDVAKIEMAFPTLTEEQHKYIQQFWQSIPNESAIDAQQRFIKLWKRMRKLYQEWERYLKKQDQTNLAFSFYKIANNPQDYLAQLKYKHIYFVGFNALHPAFQNIINYLKQQKQVTLIHDWDEFYVQNPLNKAGLFFRQQEGQELKNVDLPKFFHQKKTIQIYGLEGSIAQAKYLNQLLPQLVQEETIGVEEIAVVLAEENLAIPVMQSIPNELKYNLSMGYPLQFGTTFRWIEWLLSLQEHYLTISHASVPKELFLQGAYLFKTEWSELIEEYENIENKYLNVDYIPTTALTSLKMSLILPIQESGNLLSYIREFLFQRLNLLDTEEEQQSLEVNLMLYTYKFFNSFYHTIVQSQRIIEPKVLIRLIRKKLQQLNVPLSGYDLNAIQVLGLLETRALDFKKVVLLSANEGILPSLNQRPSLIPDSIRRAFKLPVLEHQDALVAHVFYSLLQRAEEIHILYDQTISNQSTGEVSRFIKQIEFDSEHDIKYHHQQQKILPAKKINPYIVERTKEVQLQIQKALLSPNRSFTASSLNSYLTCPLAFYLKYVVGLREKEYIASTLDPQTVGTVIHEIMFDAYQPFLGKEVEKEDIETLLKGVSDKVLNKLKSILGIEEIHAEIKILAKITEHAVTTFLNVDKSHSPFQIIDLENDQKEGGHRVWLDIQDKAGKFYAIPIRIIADRIDIFQDAIRIIDYKTGNISQLHVKDLDELFTKRNRAPHISALFQLLLYSWVYYKHTPTDQVILPQVWSSRALSQGLTDLYIKIGDVTIAPEIDKNLWKNLLDQFEFKLKELLEEIIFDEHQPFAHNLENNKSYCESSEYAIFCLGA